MNTSLTITGSNADESVAVHFDTEVTHRRAATPEEIQAKAVAKMRTFLKRHNPVVLAELVTYRRSRSRSDIRRSID